MNDKMEGAMGNCNSVLADGRNTVTLAHALEVCALFASQEPNRGTEHVCVRRDQVEGTNGHVLMVLPIAEQLWLDGYRLMPADQAIVESQAADDVRQVLMDFPATVDQFPNVGQTIQAVQALPVKFSILVNPFYLELVGKAFGMLGVGEVQMVFRDEFKAIEIVGLTPAGPLGRVLLMPMK